MQTENEKASCIKGFHASCEFPIISHIGTVFLNIQKMEGFQG
ncbi:hypothetical protein AB434_2886 [Heyndrickxia coagulans]|uniref:Uncharacterized protein n=1 Tax=Heyndrickxia coagulans TaxID=1398 RepID=A0AAN0WBU6_HEYCO|nr:hypothetical protein SB48_HM08orf03820 [Heyndrickxia coagulans]AKN55291.1 hypothetical protein AB434_2886 [Heyndrickxia coagulans]KYC69512.1 hypothetical protein B4096_3486 [Heyndrickxia coagulans]